MTSVLVIHEVDDVNHWLTSPKRAEFFGPLGISVKTYIDPEGSNKVGLILDVPDMDAMKAMLESEAGAEAMKYDGVRRETILTLVESET